MPKKIRTILLCSFIIFLGFFRDYLFENINWIYKTLTEGRKNQARTEFHFFLEWSPNEILWLKWILTILFYGLFFYLTYYTLKITFQNKSYNRITIGLFLTLFGVSGFLYALGFGTDTLGKLYGTIRTLMGMAQSFIPLMILGILYKFTPVPKDD